MAAGACCCCPWSRGRSRSWLQGIKPHRPDGERPREGLAATARATPCPAGSRHKSRDRCITWFDLDGFVMRQPLGDGRPLCNTQLAPAAFPRAGPATETQARRDRNDLLCRSRPSGKHISRLAKCSWARSKAGRRFLQQRDSLRLEQHGGGGAELCWGGGRWAQALPCLSPRLWADEAVKLPGRGQGNSKGAHPAGCLLLSRGKGSKSRMREGSTRARELQPLSVATRRALQQDQTAGAEPSHCDAEQHPDPERGIDSSKAQVKPDLSARSGPTAGSAPTGMAGSFIGSLQSRLMSASPEKEGARLQ